MFFELYQHPVALEQSNLGCRACKTCHRHPKLGTYSSSVGHDWELRAAIHDLFVAGRVSKQKELDWTGPSTVQSVAQVCWTKLVWWTKQYKILLQQCSTVYTDCCIRTISILRRRKRFMVAQTRPTVILRKKLYIWYLRKGPHPIKRVWVWEGLQLLQPTWSSCVKKKTQWQRQLNPLQISAYYEKCFDSFQYVACWALPPPAACPLQ